MRILIHLAICLSHCGPHRLSSPQVSISRVKWIAPTGLVGVTPLLAVGPVSVGPSHSGLERSSLEAEHVTVFMDVLQSLLQRKAVLRLLAVQPQVRLQGAGSKIPIIDEGVAATASGAAAGATHQGLGLWVATTY